MFGIAGIFTLLVYQRRADLSRLILLEYSNIILYNFNKTLLMQADTVIFKF